VNYTEIGTPTRLQPIIDSGCCSTRRPSPAVLSATQWSAWHTWTS